LFLGVALLLCSSLPLNLPFPHKSALYLHHLKSILPPPHPSIFLRVFPMGCMLLPSPLSSALLLSFWHPWPLLFDEVLLPWILTGKRPFLFPKIPLISGSVRLFCHRTFLTFCVRRHGFRCRTLLYITPASVLECFLPCFCVLPVRISCPRVA